MTPAKPLERTLESSAVGVFAVFLLSACATPPGKLTDSDFLLRNIVVEQPIAQTLSAFYEGIRYCGPSSGGVIFVTHHGVPDCAPPRPDGTVVCDLYLPGAYGGRSDFVLGRIDFAPQGQRAAVALRVKSSAANKEKILDAWEQFVRGRASTVCPEK